MGIYPQYANLNNEAVGSMAQGHFGAMAVAMKGKVDAIILTGGISYSEYVVNFVTDYVKWIADIVVMPGEFEMEALAAGALRVVTGVEEAKTYTGVPVWSGFEGER